MRSEVVKIGEKQVVVQELRIKDLKELGLKYKEDVDKLIKANSPDDIMDFANKLLGEKVTELFPVLKCEDVENAYPSELEELVGAFINVNFTGIKKVINPFFGVISKGLQKK